MGAPKNRTSLSPIISLMLISIFAVVWRAIQLVHYRMIDTDSAYYGSMARFFAEGYWGKALDPYWSPMYPFLASIPFRLGISLEMSGIIVSLLVSVGTVILCFFLAKLVAGTRTGLIAAAIAALHPRLISSSQIFLTEPTYLFFSSCALTLFCYSFATEKGKNKSILVNCLTGLFLSLAFLTRPEGMFYFALLLVLSIVIVYFRSDFIRNISPQVIHKNRLMPFITFFVFTTISFPYIYNISNINGRLILGEKGSANFYLTYKKDYEQTGIRVELSNYGSIIGANRVRKSGNYHMFAFAKRRPGVVVKRILKNIPRIVLDKIPNLMYWPLFLLSLFGLIYRKRVPRSSYEKIYVIWILVPVAIYCPLFLFRRFFIITLPLLITWCAIGIEELRYFIPRKAFMTIIGVCVILLLFYTNSSLSSSARSQPILYKEAGLWLKKNADKTLILAGRKPETSFYAQAEFRPLEGQNTEELHHFLAKEGITHLVVEDYILPRSHPGLVGLLELKNAPQWLKPVFSSIKEGHKLIIYEFCLGERIFFSWPSIRKDFHTATLKNLAGGLAALMTCSQLSPLFILHPRRVYHKSIKTLFAVFINKNIVLSELSVIISPAI